MSYDILVFSPVVFVSTFSLQSWIYSSRGLYNLFFVSQIVIYSFFDVLSCRFNTVANFT